MEHRSGKVDGGTLNTIQAAQALGPEVSCLVSGHGDHLAKLAEDLPVSKVIILSASVAQSYIDKNVLTCSGHGTTPHLGCIVLILSLVPLRHEQG